MEFKNSPRLRKWAAVSALALAAGSVPYASYYFLHPLALRGFDRAEDLLEKEGLDPAIAAKLAEGNEVRVRRDTVLGMAHAVLDYGVAYAVTDRHDEITDTKTMATSTPSYGQTRNPFLLNLAGLSAEVCPVYFPVERDSNRGDPSVTHREVRLTTLFHEFRHCGKTNRAIEDDRLNETDADYASITMAAEVLRNPAILVHSFQQRGLQLTAKEHDNILYLVAMRDKKPLPSAEAVETANQEALKHRDFVTEAFEKCAEKNVSGDACPLPDTPKELSPLAQQRLDLFKQGYRYFYNFRPVS